MTNSAVSNGMVIRIVATVAIPMENDTGTLKNISRKNSPNRTRILNISGLMQHPLYG